MDKPKVTIGAIPTAVREAVDRIRKREGVGPPGPKPDADKPPALSADRTAPCVSRGAVREGEEVPCLPCGPQTRLKTFDCDVHGRCTVLKKSPGVACCRGCSDYIRTFQGGPDWDRKATLRYDRSNLYPELAGFRFNPGLIAWEDGYALVWRDGWAGSDLWLCRLNRGFRPVGRPKRLQVHHAAANYGREDPCLFTYGGKLHVSFVGVQGRGSRVVKTNVLFGEILENFTMGPVYAPRAPGTDPSRWEKNWGFFEHDGELLAVYSVDSHRILRVRGNSGSWAADTPNPLSWHGGERRGGAPPVRVGDEFWSFFHDRIDRHGFRPLYRMGLYCFGAKPPFTVTRQIPEPILVADPATNPGNYCDCVFPRGAVRVGDDWIISCGAHDRHTEFHVFNHRDLERRLVPTENKPEAF